MNFNSKSYKPVFFNTVYLDRAEYFPQSCGSFFVIFNHVTIYRQTIFLGHANCKNG